MKLLGAVASPYVTRVMMFARIKGVDTVTGVNLFERQGRRWRAIDRAERCEAVQVPLEEWQLPELLAVSVNTNGVVPDSPLRSGSGEDGGVGGGGGGAGGGEADGEAGGGVAVPVVPDVC